MKITVYLGPPGTGKTATLLNYVERADKDSLKKTAYISFTRQAVAEATRRSGLSFEDTPYFRTIHSMGFKLCGFSPINVMSKLHYKDLGKILGLELTGNLSRKQELNDLTDGDKALAVIERARLELRPLKEVYDEVNLLELNWLLVDLLSRTLATYKKVNFLVDYTGMLEKYLAEGPIPPLETLILDEAQDLSPLQWKVLEKLSSSCSQVIMAGDDDQAIYRWAGANPEKLIQLTKSGHEIKVLGQSYRLPKTVHQLAMKVVKCIGHRFDKKFMPREEEGKVDFRAGLEDLDLAKGEWLLLYRNRYLAEEAVAHCRREGFHYDCFMELAKEFEALQAALLWEDARAGKAINQEKAAGILVFTISSNRKTFSNFQAYLEKNKNLPWYEALPLIPSDDAEYIRAARRRGERFTTTARIKIDTIHGAKGAEAENIGLCLDMSPKSFNAFSEPGWQSDDEWRVLYVGVTRAKKCLFPLRPVTPYSYSLEEL